MYTGGIPLNVLRSFDFEVQPSSHEAIINCSAEAADGAMNLTACSISLSATNRRQQAGIRCFQTGTNTQLSIIMNHNIELIESCEDGDVRIINNAGQEQTKECLDGSDSDHQRRSVPSFETATEGRIEICFQNVWGAIYDTNFTNLDAAVACHQLGYSRYGNAHYDP